MTELTKEDLDEGAAVHSDGTDHHCHALGCAAACPPRWLMCKNHWSMVPPPMQAEVYRTVKVRGRRVDASWAPWWRAQGEAIAFVAHLDAPNETARDRYLGRAAAFADKLEKKT